MAYANCSTVRYRLRHNDGATDQCLQVRLGHLTRVLTGSPFSRIPYHIVQESITTPMADTLFYLPLREIKDRFSCSLHIFQLLSSFNLGFDNCIRICLKIESIIAQLTAGNCDSKFHIVADIDNIQMFWLEQSSVPVRYLNRRGPGVVMEETMIFDEAADPVPAVWIDRGGRSRLGGVVMEETLILDEAPARRAAIFDEAPLTRMAAPVAAIEKLKKEKFDGIERGEELGDCSVCYEELKNEGGKEVCRIPCGHVYHKSCILTWAQMSNSCPLCRRKLED